MDEFAEILVFDSGPLSVFAEQGWLGLLRRVVGERRAIIPDTVVEELQRGSPGRPYLEVALKTPWIEHVVLNSSDEMDYFGEFSKKLVANGRNVGEAGVLAYAKANSATAVIDDGAPRTLAQQAGVLYMGTLKLLCQGLRSSIFTIELISAVADDLLEVSYRLPFQPGGFERWARDNGLV